MEEPELGRVETMDVRTVWPREDHDFTPWLAKNLELLGGALDMKLKLIQPEAPVGPYYLDILAKEVDRDVKVVIENQYGVSDMTHLGQLLIYAAGLDARIAIWVAPEFGYEHAEALVRLNEWTHDGIAFYGVQVSVIKIGDSKPAPVFRPVVSPGFWNKHITLASGGMSQRHRRFHDFFQPLIGELIQSGFRDGPTQRFDYTGRYFRSPSNRGVRYAVSLEGNNDAWVTLHIEMGDKKQTKHIFDTLLRQQEQIQECLAGEWHWNRHNGQNFSSINIRRDGSIDDCVGKLKETRAWMLRTLPKLREVFDQRVADILGKPQTLLDEP